MIVADRLTKHERGVLTAALAQYRNRRNRTATESDNAKAAGMAKADTFVAADLLRQITDA